MLMYLSCGWRFNASENPPPKLIPPAPPRNTKIPGWKIIAETKAHHDFIQTGERSNWEFYVVIRGELACMDGASPAAKPGFQERTLWVHPPGSCHYWRNPPGRSCLVLVFHFATIPALFEAALGKNHRGQIQFHPRKAGVLKAVFDRIVPHYRKPEFLSPLLFEAAVCELSAFFLAHHETLRHARAFDPAAPRSPMRLNTTDSIFWKNPM